MLHKYLTLGIAGEKFYTNTSLAVEVSLLKSEVYSIPLTFFRNQFNYLDVVMNGFDGFSQRTIAFR